MLKHTVQLEIHKEDRTYMFTCDQNAPIVHVKEALLEIMKIVTDIEEKIMAANQQAAETVPQETKNE